jgi:hypothetical protein
MIIILYKPVQAQLISKDVLVMVIIKVLKNNRYRV